MPNFLCTEEHLNILMNNSLLKTNKMLVDMENHYLIQSFLLNGKLFGSILEVIYKLM